MQHVAAAPDAAAAAAAAAPALEPTQVLQLLTAALSHDQATQKQAEKALQSLEPQPGYVSCLAVRYF